MLRHRRGFTLIEILVVILIISILVALLLPAIHRARAAARQRQCLSRMRQVGMAITQFADHEGRYPAAGYWDSQTATTPMRSWVVDILPYIGSQDVYDAWDTSQPYTDKASSMNGILAETTQIDLLVCPDDESAMPGNGNLSYVVNGGFAFSRHPDDPVAYHSDGWITMDFDGDGAVSNRDRVAMKQLGVFFLESWPLRTGITRFHSFGGIRDGASSTIMLSENVRAGYDPRETYPGNWASPWVSHCMFFGSGYVCPGGNCTNATYENANDRASFPAADEAINASQRLPEGSPWVSSFHSGAGVNVVLCDGSARFLSEEISGLVFAKLLTSDGGSLPTGLRQSPLDDRF